MTKHIITFGDLNSGDHIFRYRIVKDKAKLETLVVQDIKITNDKAIIIIKDSSIIYTFDKERTYIMGGNNDDWSSSVIVSDYELVEFIKTVINITKQPLIRQHVNLINFISD